VKPRDLIGLVLAIGLCTSMNVFTFAVLYDAVASKGPGLSENATQILTGWGGGIVGILGALLGYRTGIAANDHRASDTDEPD
jgi:hypothetical protein